MSNRFIKPLGDLLEAVLGSISVIKDLPHLIRHRNDEDTDFSLRFKIRISYRIGQSNLLDSRWARLRERELDCGCVYFLGAIRLYDGDCDQHLWGPLNFDRSDV